MRWGAFISLVGLGLAQVGCASGSKHAAVEPPPPVAQPASVYEGAVAASLMYSPTMPPYAGPPLDLSREGRAPAAYAGFDDVITTYYYLYQDDRQLQCGGASHDRFERQAITQRVGVSYR
jgi:hypothetical protein